MTKKKIPLIQDIQGELKNPIRESPATLLVIIRRWRGSECTSLASRVVSEGTLAEWNACQKQGPINIPWHPIDFSKWVPFLICKSSLWCFMLCLSLCIQCALSTFKFLLFPSNNHTQSTILTLPSSLKLWNMGLIKHSHYKRQDAWENWCK